MKFPTDFYEHLNHNTLIEIKGGLDRKTFLKIWMVAVEDRVFARSWTKSERSWFTAIKETKAGQIKYGTKIIHVTGLQLASGIELHQEINQQYLEKYTQEANIFYAKGITQPEYEDYTMEFFFSNQA